MTKKFLFIGFLLMIIFVACNDDTGNEVVNDDNVENVEELPYYVQEIAIELDSVVIYGTLVMPDSVGQFPLVIIVAGSGPTDRDGNNALGIKARPYFMIAEALADAGIATFRYDKRAIGESVVANFKEKDLRFDNYVDDLIYITNEFKFDERFNKIIILGHSEGALIGAIACNKVQVDKFISVSGTSRPADSILMEQLSNNPDVDKVEALRVISEIKEGKIAIVNDPVLQSIFRVSVQPYITSWVKYNPKEIYAELSIPTLIIHGTTDIQVPPSDAKDLAAVSTNSTLSIIDGMNHILKDAPADTILNSATYVDPKLPLNEKFVADIVSFILE